jgi:hypothetical protein
MATSQFAKWVYETHVDQLHLEDVEGGRRYQQFIHSMTQESIRLSGALRSQSFHVIKFGYPMRRSGYEAAVFTVSWGGDEAYYAYAYWPPQSPTPEYVCISPTFESRDGEYRHHFLWYPQFLEAYEKLVELAGPAEENILAGVRDGKVEIDVRYYTTPEGYEHVRKFCEGGRIGIQLLISAVLAGFAHREGRVHQNHTLEKYVKVLTGLNAMAYPDTLPKLSPQAKDGVVQLRAGNTASDFTQCGQKLTPLTLREATNVGDVNYAAWREVWVNRWATDLIINGVSPAFPIYNNWTYIVDADQDLFENKHMRALYTRGLKAIGVLEKLRDARAEIKEQASQDYRIGQLDAHIYSTLVYALDYLIMSKFALCSTSEYVGVTFKSIPDVIRLRESVSPSYTRMFSEPSMGAKYLADLAVGVHALHTRVGAIHADLHLNNMTLHPFLQRWDFSNPEKPHQIHPIRNPVMAYIAGPKGELDTYIFPHDGWFATIIDFSRSILGPTARARLEEERGAEYTATFFRAQASRALKVLHHYIPGFAKKHQAAIKGLLLSEPDVMFRIMTAVDFLAIGRNFGALLKNIAKTEGTCKRFRRPIPVSPELAKMASKMERVALEHLVSRLSDVVTGQASRNPKSFPFMGSVIMPAVFAEYSYRAWAGEPADSVKSKTNHRPHPLRDTTLVDLYNVTAPLEYSSTDPERFPPWAKFSDLEKHLGSITMKQLTADRTVRPFLKSQALDTHLDVLLEAARQETLPDHPADATSSWIAD